MYLGTSPPKDVPPRPILGFGGIVSFFYPWRYTLFSPFFNQTSLCLVLDFLFLFWGWFFCIMERLRILLPCIRPLINPFFTLLKKYLLLLGWWKFAKYFVNGMNSYWCLYFIILAFNLQFAILCPNLL